MGVLRLYDYAASANCLKVRILLGLLEREYERIPVDIFAGETLTDEFAALNPLREVPVLELADGRTLADSGAILTFLADGSSYLPDDAFARAEIVRWLVFEQLEVIPSIAGLRFRLHTGRYGEDHPEVARRRAAAESRCLPVLDGALAGSGWLVGDSPTVADIACYGYTHRAGEAGIDLGRYPRVSRWIAAIEQLPGFANDLAPYPDNARPGAGRSIYD